MLALSNILLWIVVVALTIVVAALARQLGVLYERIAPMGALVNDTGPAIGDVAPTLEAETFDGGRLKIGVRESARPLLLLFVAPTCPVCRKIIPIAKKVALAEGFDLAFVGDGDKAEQIKMRERYELQDYPFANSPTIGLAFHVGKLPYAVLIGSDGRIASKGLVNTREHLESMAVAQEIGFPSAQAYISSKQNQAPADAGH